MSASDPLNSNPTDHDYIDLPQNSGLESSEEEAQDEVTTRHYQRIQRAEESWSKLWEAMLWTTLHNQRSLLGKKILLCLNDRQPVKVLKSLNDWQSDIFLKF